MMVVNRKFTPVTLPPGRIMLATSRMKTGSPPRAKTTGIVLVMPRAATDAAFSEAKITSTGR